MPATSTRTRYAADTDGMEMNMTDEESMGRWFSEQTKPQLARYNQRMADAAPYRGSPKWERKRTAAQHEFHETTSEARGLYELAMADLMTLGEISESTDFALTQFQVGEVMRLEAAE